MRRNCRWSMMRKDHNLVVVGSWEWTMNPFGRIFNQVLEKPVTSITFSTFWGVERTCNVKWCFPSIQLVYLYLALFVVLSFLLYNCCSKLVYIWLFAVSSFLPHSIIIEIYTFLIFPHLYVLLCCSSVGNIDFS